jgi:AcrR family transcriptional regulator
VTEIQAPVEEVVAASLDGTRDRILDAALEVLRDVGHGQFSVQKVARRAGVYQGNITYYWPRRRDLVLALALRVVEEYRRGFPIHLPSSASDPRERAELLVRAMVEDAVSIDRVRLLPELWSIANGDPDIAAAVTQSFDEITTALVGELGAAEDDPAAAGVRSALYVVGVAVQGLTAVHIHRPVDDAGMVAAREAVIALLSPVLADALAACRS